MSLLITYPHGLGDCLMLTPSLREYSIQKGCDIYVAILERFKNTEIFKNNPYVKDVFYIKDPWNDFGDPSIGFRKIPEIGLNLSREMGIDNHIFINHTKPYHKIIQNSNFLGIDLNSYDMEVYISDDDRKKADDIINNLVGDNPYGFIQTHTGVKGKTMVGHIKNLPEGYAENWLRKNTDVTNFIEVQKDFNYNDFNINIQFEILRRSKHICLPDSVFYHASIALEKDIDFVFFGRGKEVYDKVGCLNKKLKENYTYVL